MADNLNITPEMLESLVNTFKSKNSNTTTSSEEKVSSSNSSSSSIPNGFGNFDIETIMKIKSVMDSLNSKDNRDANLLYSLKPYLRKSRQDKIDQYINILKISEVSKIFKNDEKGEK